MKSPHKCKVCKKILGNNNKSGYCSACYLIERKKTDSILKSIQCKAITKTTKQRCKLSSTFMGYCALHYKIRNKQNVMEFPY